MGRMGPVSISIAGAARFEDARPFRNERSHLDRPARFVLEFRRLDEFPGLLEVTVMALTPRSLAASLALAAGIVLSATAAGAADGKHAGMVLIPAGEFTMGRDGGPSEEGPAHKLFLPAFHIDRNLVTMKEYARFIQAKGPVGPRGEQYLDLADEDNRIHLIGDRWQVEPGWEDHPASELALPGAVAYCKWLEKRLPSEAEWEKAARGADGRLYPWGNGPPTPELAFFGGWRGESVPVGRYPKGRSPYGVLDMAGQVWEWTRSTSTSYPYDPKDGREDLSAPYPRVTRGGNASSGPEGLTATSRHSVDPGRQARGHAYYGFRCSSRVEMVF